MLIVVAFAGGVLAMLIRLPPMVGFLAAGFVLHMLGYRLSASVEMGRPPRVLAVSRMS